jgi:multicomponent Na+:H+ antiporter subunit D
MVKGALFIVAGILLHRFEAVDERQLHGQGRGLWWTAAVLFVGALALAGFPGSGLATGDDLIGLSAKNIGLDWTRWVFVFAEALTAAAVLRSCGCVFFGWGPAESQGDPPEQEEKPETKRGHEHTPASMFVPGAVLLIMGLLVGLVPGLKSATVKACEQFENSNAYAAHVLDSQPMPQLRRAEPMPSHPFERLIPVLAAMAIAAMALFAPRGYEITAWLAKPLHVLHRLHSGHIGDYIAFLTFGLACFGLICAYCFR